MKARQDHPSAVDTQFDEWAKAVAHGLTRRKTLQLIGGTFTGAFLALRGSKAWAAPSPGTQGCGHICAPLFNPSNQAAFSACTQACEDCQSCHGSPSMVNTSPQVLVCTGATPCRSGSGVICCKTGDAIVQQTCCHGACYNPCTGGQVLSATTCTCACPSGSTLCNGTCVGPCSGAQVLNPTTCTCGCASVTCGTNQSQDPTTCACVCNSGYTLCGGTTCIPSGLCCAGGVACLNHLNVCCGAAGCVPSGQCCGGVVCLSGQTCIGGICTST